MGWCFDGSVSIEQFWRGILDKNNIHSFHLCMISGRTGNRDEAWPMYHVWSISERFMLGWSGGTWPACCHWLNTGKVDGRCPIMFVLTQSYPSDTWFVCSALRELAVSNLGQLLLWLSITWSRCSNAYWDLWIMTIVVTWLQVKRSKYTLLTRRFKHCYVWHNYKISHKKQPWPLADAHVFRAACTG